jgi:uncharacterized protein with FMN-binding domain
MLGRGSKPTSLAGRLLLSSALVTVSLAYGWWQRQHAARPAALAPVTLPPPQSHPAATAPQESAEKSLAPKIPAVAPKANAPAAASAPPAARSQSDTNAPASPVPVSALASLRMYQPPPAQTPLALVTGTPAPGAAVALPAGAHLEDGDYLSDSEQYEWGDLQVKITVKDGQIRAAQIVQYPDHRAESLEISQMSAPRLCSELIKTQQAKVDIVSSATDTSYVFRDAAASAILKATR